MGRPSLKTDTLVIEKIENGQENIDKYLQLVLTSKSIIIPLTEDWISIVGRQHQFI